MDGVIGKQGPARGTKCPIAMHMQITLQWCLRRRHPLWRNRSALWSSKTSSRGVLLTPLEEVPARFSGLFSS
jgi:hypothetical protein